MIRIAPVCLPDQIDVVRVLFNEYMVGLGIDLSYQDVEAELAQLPGKYAPPAGIILLARDEAGEALGCAALRPLADPRSCEMKRLYVRPQVRGKDLGRRLAEAIIEHARRAGHAQVFLDTLASMHIARRLYASLGFRPTNAYNVSPLPGTLYFRLDL